MLPPVQLEDVYGEIYRVLKPGATFVSYEWVTTKRFDGTNTDQRAIIDEIIIGNGLPVSCQLPTGMGCEGMWGGAAACSCKH